jgi:hypothetical protein
VRFRVPRTEVIVEYDDRYPRTIFRHGAHMAYVDDEDYPGAWMLQQHPGDKMRLVVRD